MAIEWAGLSPEVLLRLDREGPEPLRAQLEGGLREAIRAGRLQAGERLPSSRELARQLGVSRGLVQECYGQLYAEGYLTARVGSATRVAATSSLGRPARSSPAPAARLEVDFASGVPDLASFPRADWAWAVRDACRTVPTADLHYGDPRGDRTLRSVLAGYLRRVRAAVADPADIVVCTGFAQGLGLALRVLSRTGVHTVAFEDPGNGRGETLTAVTRLGLEVTPVPVDERGIDVTTLARTAARAVVLTPAHQSPTGVVLAPDRRHALAAWAAERDAVIVEDDYDAEFRYDREPVGTLQGIAAGRVVLLGTVSKSLAPAMRLGWVVCPPHLTAAVIEEKRLDDRGSPGLDQLALARLIESGRYDRHLRRMRAVYATRREALVDALARHAPGVRLTGLAAGFHAVAHLPEGVREEDVVAAARERSVGLYGMSTFRMSGNTTPAQLVMGFGNLSERAIESGIATVADLLEPADQPG
ncbi:PLP-dependent aminotransferase family protein [Plantactinospora mayteni]|uniref:GntR family transcriptional regulator n=1 Tax=Plantactinospora mayteni TaxID=566021 RepID=A0ABQ4EKE7_9ACTN|nr:PLP-dependent aminotransferase family protein [Plantactinospora mayteni]GIG95190.1 GntR family transcriptional regulator [Plantactinospora mayteni]